MGENDTITKYEMSGQLANSELVIGLACAVGTNISTVIDLITNQLKNFGYDSTVIKISKQLIEPSIPGGISEQISSNSHA